MRRLARLLALAALLLATPAARAAGVGGLIDRIAATYGTARLAAGGAVREEGSLTPLIRHRGETATLTRLFDARGRLRVAIAYSGGARELRLLDRGRGWRDGRPVAGPLRTAMVVQAARLVLPWLLQQHAEEVIDGGTAEVAGRPLRLLALPMGPARLEAAVDPATARILRTRGLLPMGPMTLTFTTELSDFRRVGGLLVPFHEENWAQGRHTATTTLTRVTLLPHPDPKAFQPEGGWQP